MPLVIRHQDAKIIRDETGFDVRGHPDYIVTIEPPAGWPLGQPWPPKVSVPKPPCCSCITGTAPATPLDHLRLLAR